MSKKKTRGRREPKPFPGHEQQPVTDDQLLQASSEKLRRRHLRDHAETDDEFRPASDGVRMSDLLEQFVEPLREDDITYDEYVKLLYLGAFAWNLTLLPRAELSDHLEAFLAKIEPEGVDDVRDLFRYLLARKNVVFSAHRRVIDDFELVEAPGRWHLTVLSDAEPIPREKWSVFRWWRRS